MSKDQSRRSFLKRSAAVAGALTAAGLMPVPHVFAAAPGDKLRVAVVGCGGQGTSTHISNVVVNENLVAIVDADERRHAVALKQAKSKNPDVDPSKIRTFTDYRKLFDEMKDGIDAITVATPNHHHCLPALIAMSLGKGAYVEKPMAHDIHEAHMMAEFAKKYKVPTQMGNQGHSGQGWRRFCEYIWAGAIGHVHTVYCWTNRANGGVGPRPPTLPVPKGLNWENWIGPAPYRDFHTDLVPHEWHGWHDFGNGSLGNMACHIMDGAHWALKLAQPTAIECEEVVGGTEERYPLSTRIRWDYPARGDMPKVKVYWYDGIKPGMTNVDMDRIRSVTKEQQNRPELVTQLEKNFGRNFGGDGSMYIGEKGIMVAGCYGDGPRIIPESAHQAVEPPPQTLPRVKGNHFQDFFRACKDGQPAASDFSVASKLVEMILLGWMAVRAGVGKKLEWDGNQVTNLPEANGFMQREYRKGWSV